MWNQSRSRQRQSLLAVGIVIAVMFLCVAGTAPAQTTVTVGATVEGTSFTATSDGTYRFTMTSGAVQLSPETHPYYLGWTSEVLIYVNRAIYWFGGSNAPDHPNPASPDFIVGDGGFYPTFEQAEQAGMGTHADIPLLAGQYVILVVDDSREYFWDNYGSIEITVTTVTEAVTADVNIDPDVLNLRSKGKWITCYIQLPNGYDVADIDVASIRLEGSLEVQHSDLNGDVLMVKFDRSEVQAMLEPGENVLTLAGQFTGGGLQFQGSDTIQAINPGKK